MKYRPKPQTKRMKRAKGGGVKMLKVKPTVKGKQLKPVPMDKKKSLGKLPTAVRNKMGFMKSGGMSNGVLNKSANEYADRTGVSRQKAQELFRKRYKEGIKPTNPTKMKRPRRLK